MIRSVLAVIAGFVVAIVGINLVEAIGALVAPAATVPPNLDDRAAMAAFLANLPWKSNAFILAAYLSGTVAGVVIAASIVPDRRSRTTWVVGGLVVFVTLVNLLMLPHPAWFSVAAFAAVVLGIVLGRQLGPIQSMRRPA
jgi:hypothetical protein